MSLVRQEPGGVPERRKPKPSKSLARKGGAVRKQKFDMPVGGGAKKIDDRVQEPPIGSVLKVSGQHVGYDGRTYPVVYDYAVIRAGNGRWYTTGASCPYDGYSWSGFLEFLASLVNPVGERLK